MTGVRLLTRTDPGEAEGTEAPARPAVHTVPVPHARGTRVAFLRHIASSPPSDLHATRPDPSSGFGPGGFIVDVRVLAYQPERMLSVRWVDADPAGPAVWSITRTLEQEGRGTRLFLVHERFNPDDPAQMMARKIMGGGRSSHVLRATGQTLDRR